MVRFTHSMFFSVIFCVLLCQSWAHAQDQPSPATEEQRQQARTLFQQGVTYSEAGNWEQARQAFQRAYDLVHEPSILLNLGQSQAESGQLAAGADSYRRFLAEVTSGRLTRHRRDAQQALRNIEQRLPKVKIQIADLAEGDVITLDGEPIDRTQVGTNLPVAPGRHSLSVTRSGVRWGAASFEIAENETRTVEVALQEPSGTTPQQVDEDDNNADMVASDEPRRSRRGLWIGLGVGGGVAVLATIITVVVVTRD